jgi:hypothetical protein
VDSGRAVYEVTGSVRTTDSTTWQIEERRNIVRHRILYNGPGSPLDTTYTIVDTTDVELIESSEGQHHLYRNADPDAIRFDVFPFTKGFVDTTRVYRYAHVDAGDTVAIRSNIPRSHGSSFRSDFTFRKGVGLIRNIYNDGMVDVSWSNAHVLLSSTISSVQQQGDIGAPGFALYQNYPNPFNPTTTIRFSIAGVVALSGSEGPATKVWLAVYDVLGREVAVLVNETKMPGSYEVTWNAGSMASGVYFYRIETGDPSLLSGQRFIQTRKLLVIR